MAKQHTMNVSLTPALAKQVAARVRSGAYASASDVVRTALRSLDDREQAAVRQQAELRRLSREGQRSGEKGGWVPADKAFGDLRRLVRKRRGSAA